jgi:hypothetical protein
MLFRNHSTRFPMWMKQTFGLTDRRWITIKHTHFRACNESGISNSRWNVNSRTCSALAVRFTHVRLWLVA